MDLEKAREEVLESLQLTKDMINSRRLELSVCLITYKAEEKLFPDFYDSLPDGCELVIVETIEGEGEPTIERKVDNVRDIEIVRTQAYYNNYPHDFSFSKFRNMSIDLATRGWILILDTDERILWNSFNSKRAASLFHILPKVDEKFGAFFTFISSVYPPMGEKYAGSILSRPVIRLFRNDPRIRFERRCHEQVYNSIKNAGFDIGNSPDIQIQHLGYYFATTVNKIKRNVELLYLDGAENPSDYNNYMMLRHLKDLEKLGEIKQSVYFKE